MEQAGQGGYLEVAFEGRADPGMERCEPVVGDRVDSLVASAGGRLCHGHVTGSDEPTKRALQPTEAGAVEQRRSCLELPVQRVEGLRPQRHEQPKDEAPHKVCFPSSHECVYT